MPKYIIEDIEISSDETDEENSNEENLEQENQNLVLNWIAADWGGHWFSFFCFFSKLFLSSEKINDFDKYES